MTKPFLPSDIARSDRLQPWRRLITAKAIGAVKSEYHDQVIERLWGQDAKQVDAIRKAATSPASTTGWGAQLVPPSPVAEFLRSLRPTSAASQLFTSPLSMAGRTQMLLPRVATDWPAPVFVSEGGVIPTYQGSFSNVTLGPPAKLAALAAITGELDRYSAEDAETVVTTLMNDAASRALDAAVFSNVAGSASRPAGLLNGVTAITGSGASDVYGMLADIKALVGAIVAAGGGSSILIFANPRQAVTINVLAANGIGYPVIPAPSLAAGTVIAVEQAAIASGFPNLPEVTASNEAVITFEDTAPAAIGTAGSPNVVAAGTRSAFQQDLIVLRMILPCAWVTRAAGMVQYITGASW